MKSSAKKSTPKANVKLPDLKPKSSPKGGLNKPDPPTGFNDNLTLVRSVD